MSPFDATLTLNLLDPVQLSGITQVSCIADSQLWRLLTMHNYNTRVVLAGTTLLGIA